eukprot:GHVU01085164.1.p1 GENE.GHVU01085164.1~~GHVU01085164.1.p1  ORF type:complete len:592 (-),score=78.88 GHVU01085164.1:355-2052(-)
MKYALAGVKAREYAEGDQAALVSRATPDLKSMHRRLLDPCPKRLQATLAEQGVKITTAEAEGASKDCETCQLKNATNKSVPRSASRHQEPSEFGANVAWDLGHIGERGFNGEHFFSLLVESGTLWWDVKALKRKSEAPDHLTKWIATNGAPKHLLSEKGGEGEAPTVVLSRLPDLPETCPFPDIPKDEYERLKGAREQLREGETRKIGAAWYGERSSPRLFGFEFKDTMRDSGFEEIEESVSLRKNHAKPDAITVNHVDDVVGAAADVKRDVFETIEKRFKCKDATILKEGGTHTYLGVQYSLKEGAVHVSTQQYVKQLVESNPTEFLMREKGPPLREMERASVSETSPALQREYHEALGVLGWAIRLTPDQHVFHSEFGAHSACPSVRHLHALKSTLLALHSHPPAPVCLKAFEGKPMLYAFCDAAYNRVEMQCRTGYKIYVGGSVLPDIDENVIAWGTKRHKPRVASSTSAELLSLLILVKVLWRYVYVIEKMWGARPGVLVHIDSQALSQQLEKKGVSQEEPRLNPQLKYVAENMVALNGDVILVPRAQQRADALTKMTKWW